jgi:hypothetical protein
MNEILASSSDLTELYLPPLSYNMIIFRICLASESVGPRIGYCSYRLPHSYPIKTNILPYSYIVDEYKV